MTSSKKKLTKLQEFRKYVQWWARCFNLTHYEFAVWREDEDVLNEAGVKCLASAALFQEHNRAVIKMYPAMDSEPTSELWYCACHEVFHILLYPYMEFMRGFAGLEWESNGVNQSKLLWNEERVRLESAVDRAAKSLTKKLTVRLASGTMDGNEPLYRLTPRGESVAQLIPRIPQEPRQTG